MQINCFPSRITGKPSSLGLSPKTVNNQQFKISLNLSQGRASTEKQKKTSSIFPPQTLLLFFFFDSVKRTPLPFLGLADVFLGFLDFVGHCHCTGRTGHALTIHEKKWARFGLEKRSFLVEWQWSCFYQWKFRCTTHTHSRRATDDWHSLARLSSSIDKKTGFPFWQLLFDSASIRSTPTVLHGKRLISRL